MNDSGLSFHQLKEFLEEKTLKYNQSGFILTDPIQVPKHFSKKQDIEISGFLTAAISWGNRKAIIANAHRMMGHMDFEPYGFIMQAGTSDLEKLEKYVHRTFNGSDLKYFVKSLKNIYAYHGGLEKVLHKGFQTDHTIRSALSHLFEVFFEMPGERTRKHLANVQAGASAKRMNMFLRWMVRDDGKGVDFGLWKKIPSSALMLPLDVHTGNVARKLGMLTRKSNDWKAVEEVTDNLRKLDPFDPVKYDFALFGLGIFENF